MLKKEEEEIFWVCEICYKHAKRAKESAPSLPGHQLWDDAIDETQVDASLWACLIDLFHARRPLLPTETAPSPSFLLISLALILGGAEIFPTWATFGNNSAQKGHG